METMTPTFDSLFSPTVIFCVLNLVIGTIFITSRLKVSNRGDQYQQFSGQDTVNSHPQLVRSSSFLDRVKSFSFSSYSYRSDQPGPFHSEAHYDDQQEEEEKVKEILTDVHDGQVAMRRSKSETLYTEDPVPAIMNKSASEKAVVVEEMKRKPEEMAVLSETTALPSWEDEAVDDKADDFINRFRQQLKLQRLDSILRYNEMLNRGVGR